MSEPENFLERWSKRKLAKDEPAAEPQQGAAPGEQESQAAKPAPLAAESDAAADKQPLDPATLPSIESIGANTDVTAFLRPGVPPELTQAALRRAWSSDPAIRDFVGLVENGWDFNDPQAMPGFGPISAGDVARLAAQLIGELPAASSEQPNETALADAQGQPRIAAQPSEPQGEAKSQDLHHNIENDAPQKDSGG